MAWRDAPDSAYNRWRSRAKSCLAPATKPCLWHEDLARLQIAMTVQSWLEAALADVEARGLIDLKPLLQNLANATELLRRADWNEDAQGDERSPSTDE